jgi:hypothetical protein
VRVEIAHLDAGGDPAGIDARIVMLRDEGDAGAGEQ